MKQHLILLGVTLLLLAGLPVTIVTAEDEKEPPKDCCFEHPNYQGLCAVTPGGEETCATILDYLNSPGTTNKTYCNSTRIRGGWTQVDCKTDQQKQQEQKAGDAKNKH